MLLPIFIFLIRRLVKKLFNFEVRYINGVQVDCFTSMTSLKGGGGVRSMSDLSDFFKLSYFLGKKRCINF